MSRIDIVIALTTALFAFCYMIVLATIYPNKLLISAITIEVVAFIVVFACKIFVSRTKKSRAEAAVISELIRQNPKLHIFRALLDRGKLLLVSVLLVLVPIDLLAFTAAFVKKDQVAQYIYTYVPTSSLLLFDPAYSLELMAGAYIEAGQHSRAKELCGVMYQVRRRLYGESHEMVASILADIADLYRKEGNYETAGIYYSRALQISEVVLKDEKMGSLLTRIGNNLRDQGRFVDAEPYYQRAIKMRIKDFGDKSSNVAESRFEYSIALQKMGRIADSDALKKLSRETWEKYRASKEPASNIAFIVCMFAFSCAGSFYLIGPRGYLTNLAVKQLRSSIESSETADKDDLERLRALYRYQRKNDDIKEILLSLKNGKANNDLSATIILGLGLNHICSAMNAELLA
ncbi:MAG: tetratricopeptide repeat protein [Candidatus Obscuribacterales bacterium]|jgi:tetratricopeptide (TPR) repeat protein|nr:tetratricopeptide repeat protein [Candidatus Obscuribacterales bacterium]